MNYKILIRLIPLIIIIGLGIHVQNQDASDTVDIKFFILNGISEYGDTIDTESRRYRNIDVAVFSNLSFEKGKAVFSVINLLNYEDLKYINYTHMYNYNDRPVLIKFDKSIDSSEISRLPFKKVEKDYSLKVKKYFDSTVFITGTSKAIIFDIDDGQIKKTWLNMFEQLPIELWPYDNDLIIKEQERE